eukprot:3859837-Pleurochrysis_carterae.AAC.5
MARKQQSKSDGLSMKISYRYDAAVGKYACLLPRSGNASHVASREGASSLTMHVLRARRRGGAASSQPGRAHRTRRRARRAAVKPLRSNPQSHTRSGVIRFKRESKLKKERSAGVDDACAALMLKLARLQICTRPLHIQLDLSLWKRALASGPASRRSRRCETQSRQDPRTSWRCYLRASSRLVTPADPQTKPTNSKHQDARKEKPL